MASRATTKKKWQGESGPLPRGPYAIPADLVAADQRRRLLQALPVVVAEHGLEGATVDQVVKAAQVRRNAFYEQFADKRDCFSAAYEISQERLLGVLTYQCYVRDSLAERVGQALDAGLKLLASEPALTRLVLVEAPAAGGEIAGRHHEWLDRYGRLLRFAAISSPEIAGPPAALEPAIVGGIASRIKQVALAGDSKKLAKLGPELAQFAHSFYSAPEPAAVAPGARAKERESGQAEPQPQSSERRSVLEPA